MTKLIPAVLALAVHSAFAAPLTSPDRHIAVEVRITPAHTLEYSIARDGKPVILPSSLGLQLEGADFSSQLKLAATSPVKPIREDYELATGKKRHIGYRANEQVLTVRNAKGQSMDVAFRVSNDGVAFRYLVREPGLPLKKFVAESTSFSFEKMPKRGCSRCRSPRPAGTIPTHPTKNTTSARSRSVHGRRSPPAGCSRRCSARTIPGSR
jgi:alpha-glucosidase